MGLQSADRGTQRTNPRTATIAEVLSAGNLCVRPLSQLAIKQRLNFRRAGLGRQCLYEPHQIDRSWLVSIAVCRMPGLGSTAAIGGRCTLIGQ